jgi:LysR family hydrogen peroxide-inducible transcriptional activator
LRLTQYGEVLLKHAEEILHQLSETKAELAGLQDGIRGRLRVGSIPTVLPYYLAPRLARFSDSHPDVDVVLSEDITTRLIEKLQSGDLDLAVVALPVSAPDVVASELLREPLLLAIPPGHRLAQTGSADLKEVRHERLLLLRQGHCFRDNVLTACTRAKADFHSVFESDQFSSIFALVAAGFGISIVPQMAAADARECALLPLATPGVRRIGYLRARRHNPTKTERAFVTWLRKS